RLGHYPLFVAGGEVRPEFAKVAVSAPDDKVVFVSGMIQVEFLEQGGQTALRDKKIDLLLSAPDDFWSGIAYIRQPQLRIDGRPDDRARQARARLETALDLWRKELTRVRLEKLGLPANFDAPFQITEDRPATTGPGHGIFGQVAKIFPFMLVMWALAGALYPAVDLCAGEKERGTMETLIISPASREEIVLGKFLTIWIFSAGTSLLNLISMGLTAWKFASQLPGDTLRPVGLLWSLALLVPLSAFFSAVCLAVGAYARS